MMTAANLEESKNKLGQGGGPQVLKVASVCGMPLYFLILPMVCGNQQNLEARFQFFFLILGMCIIFLMHWHNCITFQLIPLSNDYNQKLLSY